jgi:hypothetical protein
MNYTETEISIHCSECDSQDLVGVEGLSKWCVESQSWIASSNPEYTHCNNCGNQGKAVETTKLRQ